MNREIKYRAFDDGAMFYSHNNDLNESTMQLSWFFNKVRTDAPIMQFTGLIDKNGKEIYDGDIIKNGLSGTWIVTELDGGSFDLLGVCKQYKDKTFLISSLNRNAEIIGNIYENPELLK